MTKAERTREAILQAALAEYSEVGFQGARLENIARRCGKNKALIYRYFKDRDRLFEAALARLFRGREATRAAVPEDLGAALRYWFESTTADENFMRVIMREALNFQKDAPIVEDAFRRAYYERQIEGLKAMQKAGMVAQDLPPRETFLALTALISWPVSFPQVVTLITGHAPDDPEFLISWNAFLTKLAEKLTGSAETS